MDETLRAADLSRLLRERHLALAVAVATPERVDRAWPETTIRCWLDGSIVAGIDVLGETQRTIERDRLAWILEFARRVMECRDFTPDDLKPPAEKAGSRAFTRSECR